MRFEPTHIPSVSVVCLESIKDSRGLFTRSFCSREFQESGLELNVVQANLSHNIDKGTLRGLHYQDPPYPDPKLVSCIRGSIFDVAVDIRPESPTFRQWFGTTLSDKNNQALYIPPGCAHGFLTLEGNSTVHYLMGEYYKDDLGRGVRWNDPAFSIDWPAAPTVMSERDASYPDFEET